MSAAHLAIGHLIDLLNRQCAQLSSLADVAHEERAALARLSIDRLCSLNARRAQLIDMLSAVERERAGIVNELAQAWGVPVHAVTVSLAAERAGAAEGAVLRRQHQRLLELTTTVRKTMAINQRVIARFLDFTRQALSAWQQPPSAHGLYSLSGRQDAPYAGGTIVAHKG
jgi:flagellar biosynthesis/type III secretory pathway chaperone